MSENAGIQEGIALKRREGIQQSLRESEQCKAHVYIYVYNKR